MFMIINESERNRIKSLYGLIIENDDTDINQLEYEKELAKQPIDYSQKELLKRLEYFEEMGYEVDLRGFDKGIISTNGSMSLFSFFRKKEKKLSWYDQNNKEVDSSVLSSVWNESNVEEETFGVGDYEKYQDFISNIFPNKWVFTDNKYWFDSYVSENKEFRVKRKKGHNPNIVVKAYGGKPYKSIDISKKRPYRF